MNYRVVHLDTEGRVELERSTHSLDIAKNMYNNDGTTGCARVLLQVRNKIGIWMTLDSRPITDVKETGVALV